MRTLAAQRKHGRSFGQGCESLLDVIGIKRNGVLPIHFPVARCNYDYAAPAKAIRAGVPWLLQLRRQRGDLYSRSSSPIQH